MCDRCPVIDITGAIYQQCLSTVVSELPLELDKIFYSDRGTQSKIKNLV